MEVDNVPYIFGSFSRRRHSQELNKSKRRSSENTGTSDSSPNRKISLDSRERVRSLSKPFLELFQHQKPEKEITEEDVYTKKSAVRLALDEESPIFEKTATFPRISKKTESSFRSRSSFRTTFKEDLDISSNSQSDDVKEDIYCFWCKKIYVEPRVLNCLHSFCTKCLCEIENQQRRGRYNIYFKFA